MHGLDLLPTPHACWCTVCLRRYPSTSARWNSFIAHFCVCVVLWYNECYKLHLQFRCLLPLASCRRVDLEDLRGPVVLFWQICSHCGCVPVFCCLPWDGFCCMPCCRCRIRFVCSCASVASKEGGTVKTDLLTLIVTINSKMIVLFTVKTNLTEQRSVSVLALLLPVMVPACPVGGLCITLWVHILCTHRCVHVVSRACSRGVPGLCVPAMARLLHHNQLLYSVCHIHFCDRHSEGAWRFDRSL
jgi:hypothetical protein